MFKSRLAYRAGMWLACFALLAAAPALAQTTISFYFDNPGFSYYETEAPPNTVVSAYLVLKDPAGDFGVKGWELEASLDPHAMFVGWQVEGQNVNIMTPPQFAVGLAAPLPYQPDGILLATAQILVLDVLPTKLYLDPIYEPSLPDAMAYLGGPLGEDILPMMTPFGESQAGEINGDAPGAVVSPRPLEFGEVPVGYHDVQYVTLTNVGGSDLPLFIEFDGDCPDFSLPTVSGTYLLREGNSLVLPVQFEPAVLGDAECVLRFNNPYVAPVRVLGTGRVGIVDWQVPDFLYFTETPLGSTIVRSLSVQNTGEVPFDITPTLPPECTAFAFEETYGTLTLQPGSYVLLLISFTPEVAGLTLCQLDLGDVVPDVELRGEGRGPNVSWTLTPNPIDFPVVFLPGARTETLTFRNTGEAPLGFHVALADSNTPFFLSVQPSQLILVDVGGVETFDVFFLPETEGYYSNQILLDLDGAVPVSLTGSATDGNNTCTVSPDQLDFPLVPLGQSQIRYVDVYNTGDFEMIVAPVSNSPHFSALAVQPAIAAGGSGLVKITFHPQTLGPLTGSIQIGGGCSYVQCTGLGGQPSWGGDDQDLVALYFDPEFSTNEMTLPTGQIQFTAYLVLHYPSLPGGLAGWECRLVYPSNLFLIGTNYGGDVINVRTPPEFMVGLPTPRPFEGDHTLLAELEFVVLNPYPSVFSLYPVHTPSLVNQMSWLGADYETLIPMETPYGIPEVAWVNMEHHVATDLPTPALSQTRGEVRVTWPRPDTVYDGSHIYRRIGDRPETRLNDDLLKPAGEEIVFTDTGADLRPGDRVFYSYAVVKSGVEVARSPEIEVSYTGLPSVRTRLLANVPNPFNPSTEIHFELERQGNARVDIYDVTGRHILSLCDEALSAGPHHRTWNGLDSSGRRVPSGTYYVRLVSEIGEDTRKVMLLK